MNLNVMPQRQTIQSLDPRLLNKAWRLTHLYKIRDKLTNLVTFRPNQIQLKHVIERGDNHYNLILKARQFGFTTFYCIDNLDEALWIPGMTCAIIAHEQQASEDIFEIIKRAYDNLPPEIKPKTNADNVRELEFKYRFDGVRLDSKIYVAMRVRSGTVFRLHITESAYNKDRAELNAGSKQAVPKEGYISEETTGNGYGDFYDLYMGARKKKHPGPMDYRTYFYAWFENAEYSLPGDPILQEHKTQYELWLQKTYPHFVDDGKLRWRRWKIEHLSTKARQDSIALTGEQLFKQEYPATIMEAFQSGAGSVFDLERVDQIQTEEPKTLDQLTAEIQAKEWPDEVKGAMIQQVKSLIQKQVSIWRLPEPDREYRVGCDPAGGTDGGSDNGVIDVWMRTKDGKKMEEQVAQFYGDLRPDELADLNKEMAIFYNEAFVGVENNMLTTILFLSKIYDNYYTEVKIDKVTKQKTKRLGWSTNGATRDVMIDDFLIDFEQGTILIRSEITVSEMRTFIKNEKGKREHAKGKHDDSLFAAFIAGQMCKYEGRRLRVFSEKPAGF